MNDIKNELESFGGRANFVFSKTQVVILCIVLSFGLYVGYLLEGKSGVLTMMKIQDEVTMLEIKIQNLKEESAKLQKTIFELQVIRDED